MSYSRCSSSAMAKSDVTGSPERADPNGQELALRPSLRDISSRE